MAKFALGMMSGTSMDGIDVAVIDLENQSLIYGHTEAYPKGLADKLFKVVADQEFNAHFFAHLHREVGMAFAKAAVKALKEIGPDHAAVLQVIGFHGQTICHHIANSIPYTWQIGCPHTILEACKIPVVYDFRSKNVAQGGQGAPLAPLYHQYLFGQQESALAVINIGGISNLSLLQPHKAPLGYDLGPGNCLMDAWISHHLELSYDLDGAWAAAGEVDETLLSSFMKDHFVHLKAPKSIGKEYYSLEWLNEHLGNRQLAPKDVQATLLAFTVKVIAKEVKLLLPSQHQILICGGGAKNKQLMRLLQTWLPAHQVQTSDQLGISSDYLEAMMMAWLASTRMQGIKHDLNLIMGGKDQQYLGVICQ